MSLLSSRRSAPQPVDSAVSAAPQQTKIDHPVRLGRKASGRGGCSAPRTQEKRLRLPVLPCSRTECCRQRVRQYVLTSLNCAPSFSLSTPRPGPRCARARGRRPILLRGPRLHGPLRAGRRAYRREIFFNWGLLTPARSPLKGTVRSYTMFSYNGPLTRYNCGGLRVCSPVRPR